MLLLFYFFYLLFYFFSKIKINISLDPVVLQIGAVLAVLGYKAIREILHQIGKNVDQEPAELKNYTDLVLDKAKDLDIKVPLTDLKSEIYSKIDSGEIKTAGQILKCFDNT